MDYVHAAQPRVVALFALTVLVAMLLAGRPSLGIMAAVVAATCLTVAGGALLNNCLERDLDRRMRRTRRRPTASGALSARRALGAGLLAVATGVTALWLAAGAPAAALAAAGALYYVVVYTLLIKPRTALSSIPGGIAGVFPPLIGWVAAGGAWSGEIAFLCALIVVWSPPHFWALALARSDDFREAAIPTPATVYGARAARLQIAVAVAVLTLLTLAPVLAGLYRPPYLAVALVADAGLWLFTVRLLRRRSAAAAWGLFKASGPYLALLLVAMLVGR